MGKGSVLIRLFWSASEKLLSLLQVALLLGLLFLLALTVYNTYYHPLSLYPGPKACAASRIPYFRALLGGRLVRQVTKWHEIYGPVVRIAPDELSYSSAAAWKDIYGHRQGHAQNLKDSRFYSSPISDTPVDNFPRNAEQSRYRQSLSQAFSNFSLHEQERVIKKYVDMFITRLHQQIETKTCSTDMVAWYSFTMFDITRDLAFGESFDCLKKSQYHGWISMVFDQIRVGVYLNVTKRIPGGKGLLRFLLPKFLISRIKQQILTAEGIESRIHSGNDQATFLNHILRKNDPSRRLTAPEIISNASAFILAGSETTATALCGITYYLLREPTAMKKLAEEIRSAFNTEDEITISSVSKLKYIFAVINEGMRMYPPVPIGLPRVVEGEGTVIDGQWVPGKTAVSVSQMSANRSSLNFAQPNEFIPERFLNNPEFESDKRGAFQPFLTGPRNCLGRSLAYAEMRLVLVRVLWNFDLKLDPESVNWTDQKTYFLWEKKPLKVQLFPIRRK